MLRDGVAVLAAILIAFSLDAWWTDRDERHRTAALLEVMTEEFAAGVEQLDSIIAWNQDTRDRITVFARRTAPGSPRIPDDSLPALAISTEPFQLFDPAFGALTTLISTGGLERIQDAELQSELAGWAGQVNDLDLEARQLEFAGQRLVLALADASVVIDPRYSDSSGVDLATLRRLADSELFREALLILIFTLEDYQRDLVRLRGRAAEMSERLRQHGRRAF